MTPLSPLNKLVALFIAFISGLICCRMIRSGSIDYIFLWWNLFLAWIPFQLTVYLSDKRITKQWQWCVLLGSWLLFFPNALYITTDLIHLEDERSVPIWFDAILLFTAAIAGLMMAFASLYRVEQFLHRRISSVATNRVILGCILMGSFGVYLGRFLRCNSWDIITDPMGLAQQVAVRFLFPVKYYSTWVITGLFTCLFSLLYFTSRQLAAAGRQMKG